PFQPTPPQGSPGVPPIGWVWVDQLMVSPNGSTVVLGHFWGTQVDFGGQASLAGTQSVIHAPSPAGDLVSVIDDGGTFLLFLDADGQVSADYARQPDRFQPTQPGDPVLLNLDRLSQPWLTTPSLGMDERGNVFVLGRWREAPVAQTDYYDNSDG